MTETEKKRMFMHFFSIESIPVGGYQENPFMLQTAYPTALI